MVCSPGFSGCLSFSMFAFQRERCNGGSDGAVDDGVGDSVGSGASGGDGEADGSKVNAFKVQLYCHYHVQYIVIKFLFSI